MELQAISKALFYLKFGLYRFTLGICRHGLKATVLGFKFLTAYVDQWSRGQVLKTDEFRL